MTKLVQMKKTLLIILCCIAGFSTAAQPDLERCRELAKENYPLIRRYGLIDQTKEYTLSNASRAWLPQVSLSAQATYQSDVARWPEQFESMLAAQGLDMPGLRKDQYKVQLDIQQTIWDGGKSRSDKEIAEGEAEQSRLSTDVDMYAAESRVTELYFGILLLQEQQNLLEDMMKRMRSSLEYVDALVENGVAMQADADAIEVQILSTNQNLTQVRMQEQSFRRMLELFIGEPLGEEELILPQSAEPIGFESERPELKLFDAQMSLLQAKEEAVNVSLTPKFALFAQGYYGYPGLNMFENMMSSKWSLNGIVGVRMSWNIGGFYTSANAKRQIRTAMSTVALQKDIFTFNSRLQAEQESADIAAMRAALRDDDRIVELRSSVREAAETRLQEGMIDTNDLLGKISDESSAKITRSTHEIELLKAIYDLKHTLNR